MKPLSIFLNDIFFWRDVAFAKHSMRTLSRFVWRFSDSQTENQFQYFDREHGVGGEPLQYNDGASSHYIYRSFGIISTNWN